MKKTKKIIVIFIFSLALILLGAKQTKAGSLNLSNLDFQAQINADGSMDVTETWDISVRYTNTLYKTFKTDKKQYSSITNVKVKDITDAIPIEFAKTDEWAYHVKKGYYYGTKNDDGNFEIGWGVGLDSTSAQKKYQITYKVNDVITKYNDYAQLYWQFVGKDFEVNAATITGTIYLPSKASNKDNIKVWGHTAGLNGTIYATDLNKIEFKINNFKSGTYVEVRTLFPTTQIINSNKIENTDILEKVVKEETKWANKANKTRERQEWWDQNSSFIIGATIIGVIVLVIVISSVVLIKKAKEYKAKLKELENYKKIIPTTEYKYFRDIPDESTTPGEVTRILKPQMSLFTAQEFGKVFSATILDLTLKKYLDVKIEKDEKNKENINIYILKYSGEGLKSNEEKIFSFIKGAAKQKGKITLKELEKYIKNSYTKVENLIKTTFKTIETQLDNEQIISIKALKDYNQYSTLMVSYMAVAFFAVCAISLIVPIIPGVLCAINAILCWKIKKKTSILTQEGADKQSEWKGLKTFMEEFSMLDKREVPELAIWEKYLVYATAMGVADKVIKQLKIVYPNFEEMAQGINSYTYMNLMMNTNFNRTFSSAMSSSIQTAHSTYSSAYSSGSGGGGGFSGGGGGGRRPEVAAAGR